METDYAPAENAATVKPQNVLDTLMDEGTFDNLRSSLITSLKSNDDLKSFIYSLVEKSEVLRQTDVNTKSRRQLMEELRHEVSPLVLEKASTAAWELMLSGEGLGMEITAKVDETFCDLTGSSTLGCDCHPDVGPSLKRLGSQRSDDSPIVNTKEAGEQTALGSKRPREDVSVEPISSSIVDHGGAVKKTVGDTKVAEMEDQDPASCNGSTREMPTKSKNPKGNWGTRMGSSDSVDDPQTSDLPGQST